MFARFAGLLLAGSFFAAAPTALQAQTTQAPLQDRWPAPSEQLQTTAPPVAPEPPAPAAAAEDEPPAPAAAPETESAEPTVAPEVEPAAPTAQTTTPPEPPAPAPSAPTAGDDATPEATATPTAAPTAKTTPTPAPAPTGAKAKSAAKPSKPKQQRAGKKPAAPPTVIACNGLFGPDSSHQALEAAFKEENITFTDVEGGAGGAPLHGSVLFPENPKRRLEVFWQDESQRANVRLIAINGKSTWRGPKGLRLGLTLAAVEKLNGKPFALSAIDQDGSITVTDWQEGALASLPGGCAVGMRFQVSPKASEAARSQADAETFRSTDKALRAVKPASAEILIGYTPGQ